MTTTLLVFHLIVVLLLIGVILLQRSAQEGFTGGGGGANAMMSGRGKKTLLSRVTAILAAIFIGNSLLLAFLYAHQDRSGGLLDSLMQEEATSPSEINDSTAGNSSNSATSTPNTMDVQTEDAVRKLLENSTKGVTVTSTGPDGVKVKIQDTSPAVPIAE